MHHLKVNIYIDGVKGDFQFGHIRELPTQAFWIQQHENPTSSSANL